MMSLIFLFFPVFACSCFHQNFALAVTEARGGCVSLFFSSHFCLPQNDHFCTDFRNFLHCFFSPVFTIFCGLSQYFTVWPFFFRFCIFFKFSLHFPFVFSFIETDIFLIIPCIFCKFWWLLLAIFELHLCDFCVYPLRFWTLCTYFLKLRSGWTSPSPTSA